MSTHLTPSRHAFEIDRKTATDCYRPPSPIINDNSRGFHSSGLDPTDSDQLFTFPFTETILYASSCGLITESDCPQTPLPTDSPSTPLQHKLTLITDYIDLPFFEAADVVISAMMSGKEPTSPLEKMLVVYYKAACLHTWGYPERGSSKPTFIQPSRRAEMMLMRLEGELMTAMEHEAQLTESSVQTPPCPESARPFSYSEHQNGTLATHRRHR